MGDFVKVDIGRGVTLYDTPGLILPHQLTLMLTSDELRDVVPRKPIKHKSIRMSAGKVLLLGGLARIEILDGPPFFLTLYFADALKLHLMDGQNKDVNEFVRVHLGGIISPPVDPERLDQ